MYEFYYPCKFASQLPSFRSRHDTSVGVGVIDALLGRRAVLAEVEVEVEIHAEHAAEVLRPDHLFIGRQTGKVLGGHLVAWTENVTQLQFHAPALFVVAHDHAV